MAAPSNQDMAGISSFDEGTAWLCCQCMEVTRNWVLVWLSGSRSNWDLNKSEGDSYGSLSGCGGAGRQRDAPSYVPGFSGGCDIWRQRSRCARARQRSSRDDRRWIYPRTTTTTKSVEQRGTLCRAVCPNECEGRVV